MTGKVLVDTNVLVYAYDRSEPAKQTKALEILDYLAELHLGVLSVQSLAEFFVAVTRKIPAPLTVEQAYERISNYLRSWTVLELNGPIILEAVRGVRDHKFSYWDAQLWAVARLNQIWVIYSEDFNSGSIVEGVQFIDPFL
ncbi:MAG: PIN domain-containing protein [Peptococcaceae bacterium]|nr:PIN domain-containing protein [Peptococcaceae bacterium]